MSIEITKIETGYAVKFPFELKDNFKSVFKSAKWNKDKRQWEVGPRSKSKLEQWRQIAEPLADDIADAESADMTAKELAEVEAEIAEVRAQIYKNRLASQTYDATAERLSNAKSELNKAREDLKNEQDTAAQKLADAKRLVSNACDLDAIASAHQTMKYTAERVGSGPRSQFKSAQSILSAQQQKLRNIGFRSKGLTALIEASFNRPDRDHPRFVSESDIFDIVKIEE